MFKFIALGKLKLISLNYTLIFLSSSYLFCIIFFQLEINNTDNLDLDLDSVPIAHLLIINALLYFIVFKIFIHLFYSIQSLFFDYINFKYLDLRKRFASLIIFLIYSLKLMKRKILIFIKRKLLERKILRFIRRHIM